MTWHSPFHFYSIPRPFHFHSTSIPHIHSTPVLCVMWSCFGATQGVDAEPRDQLDDCEQCGEGDCGALEGMHPDGNLHP